MFWVKHLKDVTDIKIDTTVAVKLRRYCIDKFGKTHGVVKTETEKAILEYLERRAI